MAKPIRMDELLAELTRLGMPESEDGVYCTDELATAWNMPKPNVRQLIAKAIKAGLCVYAGVAPKTIGINQRLRAIDVYKFTLPSPKKPRKKR